MNLVKFLTTIAIGASCALIAQATTSSLITDKSAWQAASTNKGLNGLTNIDLTNSTFTYSTVVGSNIQDAMAISHNAAPFDVALDDNCSLCDSDNYPLIAGGSATNEIDRRISFKITFGTPIYSFGADFTPPGPGVDNTTTLVGISGVLGTIGSGFNGFVSDTPFTTVFLGAIDCSPRSPVCTGGDISVKNLQVSTASPTAVPEPAAPALVGVASFVLFVFRRFRPIKPLRAV